MNSQNALFTHGDLTLANFFLSKKGLFLTDWEWARLDNPAYDLARLWIQTFKYPAWRKDLLITYLKKIPLNKDLIIARGITLISVIF